MSFKNRVGDNALVEICSCGAHKGTGTTSPHERALMYNWSRQAGRPEYNDFQQWYLESYEEVHGKLGETEFLFNASRFKNDPIVQACLHGAQLPKNW